jgi:O-antigen ligase
MRLKQFKINDVYVAVIVFSLLAQSFRFAYGSISLLVLLFIGVIGYKKKPKRFSRYYLWPILLFGLMALSIIWSYDTELTLKGIIRISPLILIPIVINFGYNISKKQFENIFNKYSLIYSLIALCFIIIGFSKFYLTNDSKYLFYHTLVLPSKLNAIYASSFAYVALGWILIKKYNQILYQISAIILFIFIILLSSKILIVLSVLTSVSLVIYRLQIKLRILAFAVLAGVLLVFIVIPDNFIANRFFVEKSTNVKEVINCNNFTKVYPWTGIGLRLFQLRSGFEIAKEKPEILIHGSGFNASQQLLISKHKKYNLYPGYYEYNFHNQYIQSFIELGFIGLVLLLICLFQFLHIYIKEKELFSLLIFILFLVLFFTESYLMRQRGIIFFILLYSLMPKNSKIVN